MTSSMTGKMPFNLLNHDRKKKIIIVVVVVVIICCESLCGQFVSQPTHQSTSRPLSAPFTRELTGSFQIAIKSFRMPSEVSNNSNNNIININNNNNNNNNNVNNINNVNNNINNNNNINITNDDIILEKGNNWLFFRFCLSNYLQTHKPTNCNFAVGYSDVFGGIKSINNGIDLNTVPNIPLYASQNTDGLPGDAPFGFLKSSDNSLLFEFYFSVVWPTNFSLLLEVYNKVNTTTSLLPPPPSSLTSTPTPSDQLLLTYRVLTTGFKISKSWTRYSKEDITFYLRAICKPDGYGPYCKDCVPRNNSLAGHFGCDESTGEKVCLDGWEDTSSYCLTPICNPSCLNGKCTAPDLCSCDTGWQGPVCDKCVPAENCDPIHGYCTVPGDCNCKEGWGSGFILCDLDLDYCMNHPNTCTNNGTCINTKPRGFSCACTDDYTGDHCERKNSVRTCSPNPCLNSGTCTKNTVVPPGYLCQCMAGYTGTNCETVIALTTCGPYDTDCLCSGNGTTPCRRSTIVPTLDPATTSEPQFNSTTIISDLSTTISRSPNSTSTYFIVTDVATITTTTTTTTTPMKNQTTMNSTLDGERVSVMTPLTDELKMILIITAVVLISLILTIAALVIACFCRRRRQQRRKQTKNLRNVEKNNNNINNNNNNVSNINNNNNNNSNNNNNNQATGVCSYNKTKNCQIVIKNDIGGGRNVNLNTDNLVLDKLTNKRQSSTAKERRCNECRAQMIILEKNILENSKNRHWIPNYEISYSYHCSTCGLVDLTPSLNYSNVAKKKQEEAEQTRRTKSVVVSIEPQTRSPKRKDHHHQSSITTKVNILDPSCGDFNYKSTLANPSSVEDDDDEEEDEAETFKVSRIKATCV